jgi:cyclohexanone monooxygenase
MDETACHIGYILNRCLEENISTVEVSETAEDAWVEEIIAVSRYNEEFQAMCTPGYYNNEGQPNPKSVQNGPYGKGSRPYFKITKAWRDEGTMQGLDCE